MQLYCHSFLLLLIKLIDFSYKTAFPPFYCILGINHAVGTSRSRCRGYRRHRCRRFGVRGSLPPIQVVFTRKVQMKRSVTEGETKAAAHKGKAHVLRWLGARQMLYLLRWIRMESTLICSFSESLACNLPKGSV